MSSAADVATLPRMKDGFRRRGDQVTRLEAFVDAAFAFAMTLLVISFDAIPDSLDALLLALRGVPAFAAGFAVIALFWYLHARWSRRYGLDDLYSTLLGLTLVFLVLVYVYPVKLLSGLLFAWLSGGWLPSPLTVASYADVRVVFIVYGVGFAALALCIAALYSHALRRRAELALDRDEFAATAAEVVVWRFAGVVGLLSAGSAMLIADDAVGGVTALPGFVYFLMNLTWPLSRWVARRARERELA